LILGVVIITLLVFLAARELAGASRSESAQRVASFLAVPIIPLLIIFVLMVALRIAEIVG
jgi:ABC-type Na+ efflux pump permease subunit